MANNWHNHNNWTNTQWDALHSNTYEAGLRLVSCAEVSTLFFFLTLTDSDIRCILLEQI